MTEIILITKFKDGCYSLSLFGCVLILIGLTYTLTDFTIITLFYNLILVFVVFIAFVTFCKLMEKIYKFVGLNDT